MNEKIMNEKISKNIATYIEDVINLLKKLSTITKREKIIILFSKVSGYLDRLIEEKNISEKEKDIIAIYLTQKLNNL